MAPHTGPKDAPINTKTPAAFPAQPDTARTHAMAAPTPTDRNGFTLGRVVLKLFAAMNDEKQAAGAFGVDAGRRPLNCLT